jgi:hypothetical protein
MTFKPQPYEPRLSDHELLLWLLLNNKGQWLTEGDAAKSGHISFGGQAYKCTLDLIGLPELDDATRKDLRDYYQHMKSGAASA